MADCSIFKPHHTVTVQYPDIDQLPPNAELALAPIKDSESRYEPRALVDDVAVHHHAGRNSIVETVFSSTTAATFGNTTLWAVEDAFPDNVRLVHDMRLATSGNGRTSLRVISFTEPAHDTMSEDEDNISGSNDGGVSKIRIFRCTMFIQSPVDMEDAHTHGTYEMTTEQFDDIDCNDQWMLDMRDLIHGESDRAVKYVALMLDAQSMNEISTIWKPPRIADFEGVIDQVTKPANLTLSEDRECVSCAKTLTESNALALLCNDQHQACRECLIRWFQEQGPSFVSCPHCRAKVFTDTTTIDRLKYGVVGKAYINDERYDVWENFERSCADIDKELAGDCDELIIVDQQVFELAWAKLIEGARLESAQSTPLHLQPCRAPEVDLLNETLEISFETLAGVELPVSQLHAILMEDVNRAFGRELLRSSLSHTLSAHTKENITLHLTHKPLSAGLGLRYGFAEFVEGTLSRLLQFARLRMCECDECDGVINMHGGRAYYNAENAEY